MATPRVLGQLLRLTANLCLAREASVIPLRLAAFSFTQEGASPATSFRCFNTSTLPTTTSSSPHLISDHFSESGDFARTQQGLVGTATTGNNADHATRAAVENLLGARGQLNAGLPLIGVVADDGNVVARGTAQSAAVANLLLDVRDDGTLRDGGQGQNVADGQGGVLAGVDELTGVHALVRNEGLGVLLEPVGVAEDNAGERSTTAGVVDDLLHNTANVALALGIVEGPELGGRLPEAGDGLEDAASTFPLVANLKEKDTISFVARRAPPRWRRGWASKSFVGAGYLPRDPSCLSAVRKEWDQLIGDSKRVSRQRSVQYTFQDEMEFVGEETWPLTYPP